MPAEESMQAGDVFRLRVVHMLKLLGFKVLGTTHRITCRNPASHGCSSHSHTLDIIVKYVNVQEKKSKTVIVESKKSLPSSDGLKREIEGLTHKAQCYKLDVDHPLVLDECLIISEDNLGPRREKVYLVAREDARNMHLINVSMVYGNMFRTFEGASLFRKDVIGMTNDVLYIPEDKDLTNDDGCLNPFCIQDKKCYLRCPTYRQENTGLFRFDGEPYNDDDFNQDVSWISENGGVLKQIHSATGFSDDLPQSVQDSGMDVALIDHKLKNVRFGVYLNYTKVQ